MNGFLSGEREGVIYCYDLPIFAIVLVFNLPGHRLSLLKRRFSTFPFLPSYLTNEMV